MIIHCRERQHADISPRESIHQGLTCHPFLARIRPEVGHDNNVTLVSLMVARLFNAEICRTVLKVLLSRPPWATSFDEAGVQTPTLAGDTGPESNNVELLLANDENV